MSEQSCQVDQYGRHVGTANFLEGVVRRARKYTGSLITGTQSLMDYYNNPAALVCLENSDWTVFWLRSRK